MIESSETLYNIRSKYLNEVVSDAILRGVKIPDYTLGVHYSESKNALGMTAALNVLEPQPVYATALVWDEALENRLPIISVLQATIDHEFIHEVHRSRVRRELSMPFDTPINESIIHGIQLSPAYVHARSQLWSPAVMEWLEKKNRKERERYYKPMERIANSSSDFASLYNGILSRIKSEIDSQEYMEALGIL